MKKAIISLMIMVSTSGFLFVPQKAQAADWAVGIYTFYGWWQPAYKGYLDDLKIDSSNLYGGPAIGVTFFQNWTLSLAIYYGIEDTSTEYDYQGTGGLSATDYTIHMKTEMSRTDFDLSLSYKINQQFKVFLGVKSISLSDGNDKDIYDEECFTITTTSGSYVKGDSKWKETHLESIGPGLGISYTIPIFDKTALTFATSALYAGASLKSNKYIESSSGILDAQQVEYTYTTYGNNSTVTLSYFIEPISTAISIGGRFQVLRYVSEDDAPSLPNDYFYGITASVMFLF